jgi:very-short-patch-repair endonuclease
MSDLNEEYIVEQYSVKHKSTCSIAKELNTYPKKIERILKKNGQQLRDKSEAQSLALKSGRIEHPTRGKKRTEQEKDKIGIAIRQNWKEMPKSKKDEFCSQVKKRWDEMSAIKKRELQEMAGRALRQASIDGSKAEKILRIKLEKLGYDVMLHKNNLIPGDFEIDLFLPQLQTIIEIDGPQHFLPLWGEDKLRKIIKSDERKNGLLLAHGYCVIRIKYLCKHMTRSIGNKLCKLVLDYISSIENKFPPKGQRFIELEINNE